MPSWDSVLQSYEVGPILPGGETTDVPMAPNITLAAGTILGQIEATAASAVQTLSMGGTVTSGTFILTYAGQPTAALPFNATAAQVQAALQALSNVGAGNMLCAGGPLPSSPITITAAGALANLPISLIVATSSLVGSAPTVTVANTTTGVATGRFNAYNSANTDGTQLPKMILQKTLTTDNFGNVTFADTAGTSPEWGGKGRPTATAWYWGVFQTQMLIGLDANASSGANAFGRFIKGNLSTPQGQFKVY